MSFRSLNDPQINRAKECDFVKLQKIGFTTIAAVAMLFSTPFVHSQAADSANSASSIAPFLGRWDLTLQAPDHDYPSWLEVRQEDGQLKAQMVGRWGNVRPLHKVAVSNGQITFVSPKEEEGSKADLVFQ